MSVFESMVLKNGIGITSAQQGKTSVRVAREPPLDRCAEPYRPAGNQAALPTAEHPGNGAHPPIALGVLARAGRLPMFRLAIRR